MKRIIYSTSKGDFEVAYPSWLDPFMKIAWRYLKIKTVKLTNGRKYKAMWIDEFSTN